MLGALLVLLLLGAITSGGEDRSIATVTETVTVTEPAEPTATTAETTSTFADAQRAVREEDFPAAIAIAAALGDDDENRIRRVISRHLAADVRAALRRGDRSEARQLLARAERYPKTQKIRAARASYRAARARASRRARAAREARAERRRERAAARAAAEQRAAREAAASNGADARDDAGDAGSYAGMTCPEIGHSFSVAPGSDPEHDRDNDGLACESQ